MIDVGHPFRRDVAGLVQSLQDSLLLGVEQTAELVLVFRSDTRSYPVTGVGPVSGLGEAAVGLSGNQPARFELGRHYTYASGQLVWLPAPAGEAGTAWFPDNNSRLSLSYRYRELPSGLTDFNAGSVAGTLVRAVSRELKLLYEQVNEAYRRAFIDHASGVSLDNVVALLGIERNRALPAQGHVTFSLKKAPRVDVVIAAGTRVADARGRLFRVTEAGVVPAALEETLSPAGTTLRSAVPIASVAWARLAGGGGGNLTVVPGPASAPFGADGRTLQLAADPGGPVRLRYLAKAPEVTVPVVALDDGPEGNLGSGSLTVMPTPPRGVDGGVTNREPLTGGESAEPDDLLRERAKHALERAGNATLNAIRYAVLNVDGVDSVEVRDFSVDAQIPPGEVWVRFASGTPGLQVAVAAVVDKTRSAGIKARVSQVSTVRVSGQAWLIPDVAGASRESLSNYRDALLAGLKTLAIGEPLSLRKLAAQVFRIAGLADVAELQLDAQRGAEAPVPVAADPFLVAAGDQAQPDAGAIQVGVVTSLLATGASLAGTALTLQLRVLDDQGQPVRWRQLKLALVAAVRARPAAAPNQPLAQVAQVSGEVVFSGIDLASASFEPLAVPDLANLQAATLELVVQAAAYPGLRPAATPLGLGA